MQELADQIQQSVAQCAQQLSALNEAQLSARPAPGKWSKKEIVGHLVDSALNNIQRLVRAQYEDTPHIVYDQDFWVRAADYQDYPSADLIGLWVLLNRQLCRVLVAMPQEAWSRPVDWGKGAPDVQRLDFVAADYHTHMLHHIGELTA